MRSSSLRLLLPAVAIVVAMAVPVAAQEGPTTLGANVTFLRADEDTGPGFLVDVAHFFAPDMAVVGELGFNDFDGYTISSYQGGVRFTPAMAGTLRPFVQALLGLERCCDQNAFAFQLGGGVVFPLNERFDLRAQYDFRRASYDGDGFNGNRFGVGVVFPIGN